MRRALLLPTLTLLCFSAWAGPQKATVADLLDKGKKFDKKDVVVTGTVDKFEQRTSKGGRPYVVFNLQDKQKRWVMVYGPGTLTPAAKNGDKVKVTGKFELEHHAGKRVFKNEIVIDVKTGVKTAK